MLLCQNVSVQKNRICIFLSDTQRRYLVLTKSLLASWQALGPRDTQSICSLCCISFLVLGCTFHSASCRTSALLGCEHQQSSISPAVRGRTCAGGAALPLLLGSFLFGAFLLSPCPGDWALLAVTVSVGSSDVRVICELFWDPSGRNNAVSSSKRRLRGELCLRSELAHPLHGDCREVRKGRAGCLLLV